MQPHCDVAKDSQKHSPLSGLVQPVAAANRRLPLRDLLGAIGRRSLGSSFGIMSDSPLKAFWIDGPHPRRPLGYGVTALFLALIALSASTACVGHNRSRAVRSDQKLHQGIAGAWRFDRGVLKFLEDGRFVSNATNAWHEEYAYQGNWSVSNGIVAMHLTQSGAPGMFPVGSTDRFTVLRLDSSTLIWVRDDGETNSLKRTH